MCWLCCCLFCLQKLPICWLCITATTSWFNCHTYKTTNRWHSVDAHCNVLSIQHLLPSIIIVIMIWTYWLSFCQIKTRPCGKAERSNILAMFALTQLKFTYHSKRFIAPAIHMSINRYSQVTVHHSPIVYLLLKLLVKILKPAGETLTDSVLLFLDSLSPPRFDCTERHQQFISLSLWLLCRPNQSGNIWCITHIPLFWPFGNLDGIALLYIRFEVCRAICFAVSWIIQDPIPVEPLFGVRNAFRCTSLITFDWMTVDSSDSADILYVGSSSREVLCRQSWWQRRSYW